MSGDRMTTGSANERLWLRVRRRHWQTVAYVALAVGVVVGFVQDDIQDDRERDQDQQESLDEDFLACLRGNAQNEVLRAAVRAAYAGSGGGSFDATTLPQWDPAAEESPAVAALLLVLLQPRGGGADVDVVLAAIPDRDCAAAYPGHTRGVESRATHDPATDPVG